MTRKSNENAPRPPGQVVYLQPQEIARLKHNQPGPSGLLGGYQREENYLLEAIDRASGRCALDPVHFERVYRYCGPAYRRGGPNGRLRAAFIPALRRIGIDPWPGWRAS